MNAVSLILPSSAVHAHAPAVVLATSNSLDKTKPGLVAFLVVAAIGLALWALLRSMGKQLGKAKEHFEAEDAAMASTAAAAPVPEVPAQAKPEKDDAAK